MKSILFLSIALLSFTTLALNPSRTYKQRPEKFNMKYVEKKVKTNDGEAELNVWDFPCKNGKTTNLILLVHNGEGNMADYLQRIEILSNKANVVIFDYRGFGESSDFEIDNNVMIYPHFQDDLETMIDYCRKQHVSTFNLYGWGIGAGLSLGIGFHRVEIRKIIADTPFLSMEDSENKFADWDEPMEVPFAGFEKRNEPIHSVENIPGKNLQGVKLIVGSNDIMFSVEDMKALQSHTSQANRLIDKNIYVVENPDRKDNFNINKDEYYRLIVEFFGL